jgi:hypothetical protein
MERYPISGLLKSHTPSARQRITNWMNQNFYGDSRQGQSKAESVINAVDVMTGIPSLAGALAAGPRGNPLDMAMAFVPGPGKKAIRAFHGSPQKGLKAISAKPESRQFDNATSQMGAFFSPNPAEAQRYAGAAGHVYEPDFAFQNPYEMTAGEFLRLQNINKGPNGESLPGEMWAQRADELKQEAAALRAQLEASGHDGIVVRRRDGSIMEIASFKDVPTK